MGNREEQKRKRRCVSTAFATQMDMNSLAILVYYLSEDVINTNLKHPRYKRGRGAKNLSKGVINANLKHPRYKRGRGKIYFMNSSSFEQKRKRGCVSTAFATQMDMNSLVILVYYLSKGVINANLKRPRYKRGRVDVLNANLKRPRYKRGRGAKNLREGVINAYLKRPRHKRGRRVKIYFFATPCKKRLKVETRGFAMCV